MEELQENLGLKAQTSHIAMYVGRPCQIGKGSEYHIYILFLEEIDTFITFISNAFVLLIHIQHNLLEDIIQPIQSSRMARAEHGMTVITAKYRLCG